MTMRRKRGGVKKRISDPLPTFQPWITPAELLRSGVTSPAYGYRGGMRNASKTLSLTYSAQPESVPQVRGAVRAFAAELGAKAEQVDGIRLAVSEAVTNAVLHAYRDESGSVYVTAALVSNELWILIADDGCGLEPRTDRPGLGLGLGLISQVSDGLTLVRRANGGTEVRMRFDLADERPRGRGAARTTRARVNGSRARVNGSRARTHRRRESLA